ncbi:unnamed protein product [Leptidea sinapis]|uniref:Uncharacterized protein n=1 Tax=Leptidea sinapis TaxID=189913 RepID=A0A5E4Q436_9NEOP|nr:unnamed protein product [Leptidea sinapis]
MKWVWQELLIFFHSCDLSPHLFKKQCKYYCVAKHKHIDFMPVSLQGEGKCLVLSRQQGLSLKNIAAS